MDADVKIVITRLSLEMQTGPKAFCILSTISKVSGIVRINTYRQSSIALTRYTHYQAVLPDKELLSFALRQLFAESFFEWRYDKTGIH